MGTVMGLLLTLGLLQAILLPITYGYPNGAPPTVCSSLTPVHQGSSPQTTVSPFRITTRKSGNKIRVTISGDTEFRGFVMQARYARRPNTLVEGKFNTSRGFSQTIDCGNGRQNTLTHSNREWKSQIDTEWSSGTAINEDIIFKATVVKVFNEFWTEVVSSRIRVNGEGAEKESRMSELDSEKIYDDCEVNKGCFGYPSGCDSRRNCDILLSYFSTGEGISFSMVGSLNSENYMATGLSTDARMGEDGVTECFLENGRVIMQNSYNGKDGNMPLRVIPEGMYEWQFRNGAARCSWVQQYTSIFNEGSPNQKIFHLNNSTYHALLARGPMVNGRVTQHTGRLATIRPVNFSAFESISGETAADAVKVHGAFMVTAWVALVSLAILMARYFKNDWEDQTICGVKIWFAVHRGLMITALAIVIVAFIVIFAYKGEWNYGTSNPHAILGCIAIALGVFQPIMAAFRPSPDHKKRPIFNWLHWAVGNSAQIIAIITMFFAPALDGSGLKQSFYWVLGVFVIVHCLFHFCFQLHSWTQEKKKNNEIKMHPMGSGRPASSGRAEQPKKMAGSVVRGLLLGIYVIFLTVIMLALYALIGTA